MSDSVYWFLCICGYMFIVIHNWNETSQNITYPSYVWCILKLTTNQYVDITIYLCVGSQILKLIFTKRQWKTAEDSDIMALPLYQIHGPMTVTSPFLGQKTFGILPILTCWDFYVWHLYTNEAKYAKTIFVCWDHFWIPSLVQNWIKGRQKVHFFFSQN